MSSAAPVRLFVADKPDADVRAALDRLAHADGVVAIAGMPDLHLANEVCIGTVLATVGALYPAAVGGDIGCGVAAMQFRVSAARLERQAAATILDGLSRKVPILKHRGRLPLPDELDPAELSSHALSKHLEREGGAQLGTVGRGNHFVELQADAEGLLWMMVHSGSRSFGQAVRDFHLRMCVSGRNGLAYLPSDGEAGRSYLGDVAVARRYAVSNRRSIAEAAAEVVKDALGAEVEDASFIDCDHNHCEPGELDGRAIWIHRKGAISAREGTPGIIPGSMGSPSYHVVGRGLAEALWSSSHGAGRQMSRDAARRRISVAELERQVEGVWFDHRQAHRLRDEAPAAYKDITAVMQAQRELTRIVRELRPLLSFKGT
jgi:tRNA-splicing ligase RtcB (3'-phosphate/5'-hydroxy nucleic acid ligase)